MEVPSSVSRKTTATPTPDFLARTMPSVAVVLSPTRQRISCRSNGWRERDEASRYSLWSRGSGEIRAYLDASDTADWIRLKEPGVSKKYSQELARRTIDAKHELSNDRLRKIKRQRSKDGLNYQETRLVLKLDVDAPR